MGNVGWQADKEGSRELLPGRWGLRAPTCSLRRARAVRAGQQAGLLLRMPQPAAQQLAAAQWWQAAAGHGWHVPPGTSPGPCELIVSFPAGWKAFLAPQPACWFQLRREELTVPRPCASSSDAMLRSTLLAGRASSVQAVHSVCALELSTGQREVLTALPTGTCPHSPQTYTPHSGTLPSAFTSNPERRQGNVQRQWEGKGRQREGKERKRRKERADTVEHFLRYSLLPCTSVHYVTGQLGVN